MACFQCTGGCVCLYFPINLHKEGDCHLVHFLSLDALHLNLNPLSSKILPMCRQLCVKLFYFYAIGESLQLQKFKLEFQNILNPFQTTNKLANASSMMRKLRSREADNLMRGQDDKMTVLQNKKMIRLIQLVLYPGPDPWL